MVLVTNEKQRCPVCGQAQADTDCEIRTNEQELHCRNMDCGFFASTEIHTDSEGRQFWVETTMYPLAADSMVQRGGLDHRNKKGYGRSMVNSPPAKVYALQTHEAPETRLDAQGEPPTLIMHLAQLLRLPPPITTTDFTTKNLPRLWKLRFREPSSMQCRKSWQANASATATSANQPNGPRIRIAKKRCNAHIRGTSRDRRTLP
jgi:hypothetical protein